MSRRASTCDCDAGGQDYYVVHPRVRVVTLSGARMV